MLIATTPPMTPAATATVDCTALLFGLGTALTAELVVDVSVASGAWAVPMVVKRGVAPALSGKAGDADASGRAAAGGKLAAAGELATVSAGEAVMLLSA